MDEETINPLIEKLKDNPEKFVDFMMKFELNLERPDPSRSMVSLCIVNKPFSSFKSINN